MVFSQLGPNEKGAFFELLDEYFASRPELFKNASPGVEKAAASAVQQAFASPAVRAGAQDTAKSFATGGWNAKRDPSPQTEESSPVSVSGRVAAAAAMLSSPGSRFASNSPPPPVGSRPSDSATNNLVPKKSFGDVDMSSGKNMFNSLRNSTANKSVIHPPPTLPPAFPPKKNQFSPPPMRRASSNVSTDSSPPVSAHSPAPPPPPRRYVEEEPEEPEGEWAEVMYDYSSEDPGDLQIKEKQRVLVIEKSSEDWWTGELNGKRGLIPAAYVQLL